MCTHNNYLVTAPGTIGRTNQKVLRYDQRPSYMIRSDWRIFFVPKVIWEHPSNEFFSHTKKKSVTGSGIFRRTDQKKFGTIKDLPIWFFGNKGIFVSQTSYGHTMVWSSISSDFFDFERFDRKSIKIGYKPRKVPISKTASVRLKTFLYDSLKIRDFLWVETPKAIQRFEVHFRAIFSSS